MQKPCPECSSTERKQEPGEYALIRLKGKRLELDMTSGGYALVVRAAICQGCGYVLLQESV